MDTRRYEHKFLWDEPCELKGTLLYPITMEDYYNFMMSLQCLTLPKNRSKDIKILRMNYFDYLFYLQEENPENEIYLTLLQIFLTLIFKNQNIRLIEFGDDRFGFGVTGDGEEVVFDSSEFDEVKELAIAQNDIKLVYPELDETLEEELERAKRIKARLDKETPTADLEDIVIALSLFSGIKPQEIKDMTVRKFNKAITRMVMMEDFRVYKSAEAGGMVEFKKPIPHFLSKQIDVDRNEELKMTQDTFSKKLEGVASFTSLNSQQNE